MLRLFTTTAAVCLSAVSALSQTTAADPPPDQAAPTPELTTAEWSFSASINVYVVPDDHEFVQPTFTADHDWLHLEARYNYEASDTASLWLGYNFSGGETLTWQVTPMIGGVFGDTSGVAFGYEATLNWWKFELYSEGEYVIDTGNSSGNFFYNWSELTFSPVEWFRFGLVAQRTRLYDGERDIQRGFLVGFSLEHVDLTAYVFNPDDDEPLLVFSLEVSF